MSQEPDFELDRRICDRRRPTPPSLMQYWPTVAAALTIAVSCGILMGRVSAAEERIYALRDVPVTLARLEEHVIVIMTRLDKLDIKIASTSCQVIKVSAHEPT